MDDFSPVFPCTRADVYNPVGFFDGFLVVLHNNQGVAEVSQLHQGVDEAAVISLVQPMLGSSKNIEHPGQPRTNLGGQRMRCASPPESDPQNETV
jgi:hypothetical protein